MEMKPEVTDRVMSHEKPVMSALYNSTYNQVKKLTVGLVVFKNFSYFIQIVNHEINNLCGYIALYRPLIPLQICIICIF
jgi:hypothetical protein